MSLDASVRLAAPGGFTASLRTAMAFMALGARQERSALALLLARAGFLAVLLFVFTRLWSTVLAGDTIGGRSVADLVWYLAITEWVALSLPSLYLLMESDLRSGRLAVSLSQPVWYPGARLAEAAGATAVRALVVGAAAGMLAFAFTGGLPSNAGGLWLAALLLPLALLLGVLQVAAIGLSAAWLHDVSPLYWIWQKVFFVLGGLMLPLEIYPEAIRRFAEWTPFAAMLNGPGRMAFGLDPADAVFVATLLIAWNVAAFGLVCCLWSRLVRSLDGYGG